MNCPDSNVLTPKRKSDRRIIDARHGCLASTFGADLIKPVFEFPPAVPLALKSTVFKADLQISDMDRNYYEGHGLTLAQHPSETDERLMVRLLVFALHAAERLEFGKGLSSEEPDLWRKDLTGQIELWIEIGQPDEQAIRRACGRAGEVFVYTYSGNSAQVWWDKCGADLQRCRNLTVIDISSASSKALAALAQRAMEVQCLVQDGQVQIISGAEVVSVEFTTRMQPAGY